MKRIVLATAVILAVATGVEAAQLTVGSGATLDLGTGSLDLGCADLTVDGIGAALYLTGHRTLGRRAREDA